MKIIEKAPTIANFNEKNKLNQDDKVEISDYLNQLGL